MEHCAYWGQVSAALSRKEDATVVEKYELVFDVCRTVFGGDVTPVDSSKHIPALQTLRHQLNRGLKVIFLIKDVRAYTVSELERATRKPHRYRDRWAAYHFWRWYRENRAIKDYLVKEDIPYIQIGYEELCLYSTQTVEKLCDFLGTAYEPSMLSLKDSGSHVIRGNRMRFQGAKRQGIMYDHRWFYRREWILWSMLFPKIMAFNDQVHRNCATRHWDQ
jgi:hypothetical protein